MKMKGLQRLKGATFWVALSIALLLAGCGGSHESGEHDHATHGHAHHAPHGGALVMLGNHAFQIELLPDPQKKQIDLYVLDGGAENFIRISATASPAFITTQ